MFCSECGARLSESSSFCSTCGYRVIDEDAIQSNNDGFYDNEVIKKNKRKRTIIIVVSFLLLWIMMSRLLGGATGLVSNNANIFIEAIKEDMKSFEYSGKIPEDIEEFLINNQEKFFKINRDFSLDTYGKAKELSAISRFVGSSSRNKVQYPVDTLLTPDIYVIPISFAIQDSVIRLDNNTKISVYRGATDRYTDVSNENVTMVRLYICGNDTFEGGFIDAKGTYIGTIKEEYGVNWECFVISSYEEYIFE